jgi:hypothetical protein
MRAARRAERKRVFFMGVFLSGWCSGLIIAQKEVDVKAREEYGRRNQGGIICPQIFCKFPPLFLDISPAYMVQYNG